jgi:hypothetical protein
MYQKRKNKKITEREARDVTIYKQGPLDTVYIGRKKTEEEKETETVKQADQTLFIGWMKI